jgi:hypothetical protein
MTEREAEGRYDWMPEARAAAAQCWCDEGTKHIEMDVVLAEAVARRIAAWMQTGAQFARNGEFYRGLVDECAKHLGPDAFTADDGSGSDSPIRLKVPELVSRQREALEGLRAQVAALEAERDRLRESYDDLIMAVVNKYPGETRHQTALRYIRQAEQHSGEAMSALPPAPKEPETTRTEPQEGVDEGSKRT